MTKVPDFQSQFLNSKEPVSYHKQGNMSEVNVAKIQNGQEHMEDSRYVFEESKANRFSHLL